MRGIEPVLMAIVLCVGVVTVWKAPHWIPVMQSAMSFTSGKAVATAKQITEAKKTDLMPVSKKLLRVSKKEQVNEISYGTLNVGGKTMARLLESGLYPRPADIPAGTSRAQLDNRFGQPALRTETMREGKLFERLYYFNSHDTNNITVATLYDGAVVQSETSSS